MQGTGRVLPMHILLLASNALPIIRILSASRLVVRIQENRWAWFLRSLRFSNFSGFTQHVTMKDRNK